MVVFRTFSMKRVTREFLPVQQLIEHLQSVRKSKFVSQIVRKKEVKVHIRKGSRKQINEKQATRQGKEERLRKQILLQ